MSVHDRIRTIKLLEKIKEQLEFCNEVGIYDATTIGGEEINKNMPDDAIKISGAAG
ncbi:MAG: hypothetical protein K6B14_04865 [Lachnospiraceae bacterium]|nr:hypothetical protein [Lachnospiraceae bacterium]